MEIDGAGNIPSKKLDMSVNDFYALTSAVSVKEAEKTQGTEAEEREIKALITCVAKDMNLEGVENPKPLNSKCLNP